MANAPLIALPQVQTRHLGFQSLESSIPHHERFQHMRNQRDGIDRLAVGLRMQRRIALQIGLQRRRQRDGQFHRSVLGSGLSRSLLAGILMGIGFSNGMFSGSLGRIRLLGADLLVSCGQANRMPSSRSPAA